MQRSWRQDGDKLTFIACMPLSPNPSPCPAPQDSIGGEIAGETAIQADEAPITIRVGEYDSPALMLGDVNLFLSQADDDDDKKEADESGGSSCIGELELMIAPPASRRHGYGRAAMLAFLHYINQHQDSILSEYATSVHHAPSPHDPEKAPKQKMQLRCLRVKIAQQNAKSIALFESIGFAKRTAQPNYFGELELRFDAFGGAEGPDASAGSWLPEGYRELRYERQC
ncbi:MAG: hypothetical protein M1818_003881 [Claussenomyces sp. TS43310]|nr:MAG: hypothetical protein M1818_003881 [Claussenomyces sp. TS43310]